MVGYLQLVFIILAIILGAFILPMTGNNYTLGWVVVIIAVLICVFAPAIIYYTIEGYKKKKEKES